MSKPRAKSKRPAGRKNTRRPRPSPPAAPTVIPIDSDEQWRALRARHVGSSEVAALFDQSPYQTLFTLWHVKAGRVPERDFANDRTEWGRRLEPAIAEGVSADMRWALERSRVYHSKGRLGSTVDYDVVDHVDGPGVVEIKFVAEHATWKNDWSETRAPAHFELQLQHQLACTGRPWGAIAVFVGQTASLKIYPRRPNPKVIEEIERRVAAFWQSIADRKSPPVVGHAEEWSMLREIYPTIEPDKTITIADETLSEVAHMFLYGSSQRRSGEDMESKSKIRLLAELGDAACAILPGCIVRQRPHGKGRMITVVEAETGVQHRALTDTVELA